ncbi:hypothetical protein [Pontibacter vulgaris]|uniref:hypothetical protein n=1 Tax=Pontibacter vulgaris TaxID=2905679 RepID=UPI001FA78AF8|nr:hypothetical protein [Pontibacter vulgaris]
MKFFFLCGLLLTMGAATAQIPAARLVRPGRLRRLQLGVTYGYWGQVGGYTKVREYEYEGDKLQLRRDLGVDNLQKIGLEIEYKLPGQRNALRFKFDNHTTSGNATLKKDVWYNGTLLQGGTQASINKNKYTRAAAFYEHTVGTGKSPIDVTLLGGLVLDYVKFHIDAPVSGDQPQNVRIEPYESFYRQAVPFPNIGARVKYTINPRLSLQAETFGTYIPKFKSWYTEGGNMYLKQEGLDAELGLYYQFHKLQLKGAYNFRHLYIFQESGEDTNELLLNVGGISAGLYYRF